MGRVFYWKGQTGSAGTVSANTTIAGLNWKNKWFISAANNWNNASNWALDIGQTGDSGYDEGGASGGEQDSSYAPRYMITPETWPKAGDSVVFDCLKNVFLDGHTGASGDTYPYSECLFGGTTNDYKWFDGSSTAGKLEKLTIEPGYEEELYKRPGFDGWSNHGNNARGIGARLGISMVHGKVATYGASGPNEGLGLYVAEMIDNGISGPAAIHYNPSYDCCPYYWYDWSRERTFSTNFRCDQLYVKGAGNYSFYQDELKRGCTINRIHMDRNWNDGIFGSDWYRRAFFRMNGDSVNYEITSLYEDTSSLSNQNMITSRTYIPNVVIAAKERESKGSGKSSHEIVAQVATAKIYPTSSEGVSGSINHYQSTYYSQKDGWRWTGNGWGNTGPAGESVPYDMIPSYQVESAAKLHAVNFYGLRSGISGASGPGVSNYQGVSIGHLYMYDSNPYYVNSTGSITGGSHDKNFNTVCLDISHPSFGGGTVSNIYGYGGCLNIWTGGATASVPTRILSGEMGNKVVIRGFDQQNLQYRGFEIAGHTLGIDGANHGILHLTEECDVRLGRGARIASTTAKADVDTVLTSAQVFSSKGGG